MKQAVVQHDAMVMEVEQVGGKERQEMIRSAEVGEKVFLKKILGKGLLNPFSKERLLYVVSERMGILGAAPEKLERRMLSLMNRHGERLFAGEVAEVLPEVQPGVCGIRIRLWQTKVIEETVNLPLEATLRVGVRVVQVKERRHAVTDYNGPDLVLDREGELLDTVEDCTIVGAIMNTQVRMAEERR